MKVIVVDLETTDKDPLAAKIIEVAAREMLPSVGPTDADWIVDQLTNPGVEVPPASSAIHHLIDEDLVGMPPPEGIVADLMARPTQAFVAHNIAMEQPLLDPEKQYPWLCTYRLARQTWKDAPGYSNQTLRYWLKLPVPRDAAAHRAGSDVLVTAHLLSAIAMKLVEDQRIDSMDDIEGMIRIANMPILAETMPFGKHRGAKFSEIPLDYLQWIMRQNPNEWDRDLLYTVYHQYASRGMRIASLPPGIELPEPLMQQVAKPVTMPRSISGATLG